jgi:hypothetical protein
MNENEKEKKKKRDKEKKRKRDRGMINEKGVEDITSNKAVARG